MKIFLTVSLLFISQAWAKWSVTSYNIRNFDKNYGNATDVVELGKIIKSFKSEVMGFVEVVNLDAFKTLVKKNLPGYKIQHSTCGGGGKQKLALAFDPKVFSFVSMEEDLRFSNLEQPTYCGGLRPVLLVTLQHKKDKKLYVFALAHLKAGGGNDAMETRWEQYEKLEKLVASYENQQFILMGDLNTTGYNIKDKDYVHFQSFLNSSDMTTMSEDLGCTSYWEGTERNGHHQPSILDHIVIRDSFVKSVEKVNLGSHCAAMDCRPSIPWELGRSYEAVSDHCPVQVTFK